MPVPRDPFEYAIVRVVPRVERGESMNAGIVLLSRRRRFLGARTFLAEARLAALAPGRDAGAPVPDAGPRLTRHLPRRDPVHPRAAIGAVRAHSAEGGLRPT